RTCAKRAARSRPSTVPIGSRAPDDERLAPELTPGAVREVVRRACGADADVAHLGDTDAPERGADCRGHVERRRAGRRRSADIVAETARDLREVVRAELVAPGPDARTQQGAHVARAGRAHHLD